MQSGRANSYFEAYFPRLDFRDARVSSSLADLRRAYLNVTNLNNVSLSFKRGNSPFHMSFRIIIIIIITIIYYINVHT